MGNCIAVGIGGFFGSIMRYLIGLIPLNNKGTFPANTLMINVLGAFIIGVVISLFSRNAEWNDKVLLLLKVGFCGGFTTFSTFSSESLKLIASGNWGLGILYILSSIVLCVIAVFFGQSIAA